MGRLDKSQVRQMKKVRITAQAVSFVRAMTKWAEAQIGPGYVPVIGPVLSESGDENFLPYLGMGFEKADVVDRSRIMECDGNDLEIFLYLPDELFGEDARKFVDVRDNRLIIAGEP
jgi:hypothetical protein